MSINKKFDNDIFVQTCDTPALSKATITVKCKAKGHIFVRKVYTIKERKTCLDCDRNRTSTKEVINDLNNVLKEKNINFNVSSVPTRSENGLKCDQITDNSIVGVTCNKCLNETKVCAFSIYNGNIKCDICDKYNEAKNSNLQFEDYTDEIKYINKEQNITECSRCFNEVKEIHKVPIGLCVDCCKIFTAKVRRHYSDKLKQIYKSKEKRAQIKGKLNRIPINYGITYYLKSMNDYYNDEISQKHEKDDVDMVKQTAIKKINSAVNNFTSDILQALNTIDNIEDMDEFLKKEFKIHFY